MELIQIKADFNKRLAKVEAELENIQDYPVLQKAMEVSSGTEYAVLEYDIDTLEGMEFLACSFLVCSFLGMFGCMACLAIILLKILVVI